MPDLSKVTDILLLRLGLTSITSMEQRGPIFRAMDCGLFDPEHDWSKTLSDIAGEPPYQYCRDCGHVRRSPWAKEGKP
jgi:hypothetical protein